jgi:hypothetical protein
MSIFPHSETNPDVTVENVLREHVSIKMVGQHSDVDVCKNINVRRNHVFEDGINKMARSKFEPLWPLSVKFAHEMGASEGAVDLGGLTREFLPLAIQEAFSMNAFRGSTTSKVIVINQEVIANHGRIRILRENFDYMYCTSLNLLSFYMDEKLDKNLLFRTFACIKLLSGFAHEM